MDKSSENFSKNLIIILIPLLLILILMGTYFVYSTHFGNHITIKFARSGPLNNNMPVYFRGYKIGQTVRVKPSKDYKSTLVKVWIYPKEIKLPEDVTGKVKKLDSKNDYIDLITLDDTLTTTLKNGSTIDGEPAFDLDAFLSDIADSGVIVPLLQHFSDTLLSAGKTSDEIRNFFTDSRGVLKDNRQSLKQTTQNFHQTSVSLKQLTSRFNNTISEEKLTNTTSSVDKSATNIRSASESIKNITQNVDNATKNLDKTVAKADCVLSDTKAITSNVKAITSGFCEVLNKRFAGLRIIFGKPLKNNKCPKNCTR